MSAVESNEPNSGLLGQKSTNRYAVQTECTNMMEAIVCKTVSFNGRNMNNVKQGKWAAKCGREYSTKIH